MIDAVGPASTVEVPEGVHRLAAALSVIIALGSWFGADWDLTSVLDLAIHFAAMVAPRPTAPR